MHDSIFTGWEPVPGGRAFSYLTDELEMLQALKVTAVVPPEVISRALVDQVGHCLHPPRLEDGF